MPTVPTVPTVKSELLIDAIQRVTDAMEAFPYHGWWAFPEETSEFLVELTAVMREQAKEELPIMECRRCGYTNGCAICEDGRLERARAGAAGDAAQAAHDAVMRGDPLA